VTVAFPQIKRWLANEYGLLVSEVCKTFRRAEKVFQEAKRDVEEERALKVAWLKSRSQPDTNDPQARR
jgi:hypothetical protein